MEEWPYGRGKTVVVWSLNMIQIVIEHKLSKSKLMPKILYFVGFFLICQTFTKYSKSSTQLS